MILLDTETNTAIELESGRIIYNTADKNVDADLLDTGILEAWNILTGQPIKDLRDLCVKFTGKSTIYLDTYEQFKKSGENAIDKKQFYAVKRLEVMQLLYNSYLKQRFDQTSDETKELFQAYNSKNRIYMPSPGIVCYSYVGLRNTLNAFYTPFTEAMVKKLVSTGKIMNKFGRSLVNNLSVPDLTLFVIQWQLDTNYKDIIVKTTWYINKLLSPSNGGAMSLDSGIVVNYGTKKGDQFYIEILEDFLKNPFQTNIKGLEVVKNEYKESK